MMLNFRSVWRSKAPSGRLNRARRAIEALEDRSVPATLSISSAQGWIYQAASGEANNLTISYANNRVTFRDTGARIQFDTNNSHFTRVDANTVTIPNDVAW